MKKNTLALLLFGALLSACNGGMMGEAALSSGLHSSNGDFGATQGGVQDMKIARELIAQGIVPPAEAFTVEGMFSEHDLPLEGQKCQYTLCLRSALGVAPTLTGATSGWVQVGMSSNIDPTAYELPSQTYIATVDVSGSMGWGYDNYADTPGEVSRQLLYGMAERLRPIDRFAIVIYSDQASVHLPLTQGGELETIRKAIAELGTGGSTNMEHGLKVAYQLAGGATETDEVRVLLFTDVQPNVGVSDASGFESIAQAGAGEGVGLTVFGLGVGLGPETMASMAKVRGGNAFTLFEQEDVTEFYEQNWPWFVSPIAYDLRMEVVSRNGFRVTAGYGFPTTSGSKTSLEVSSVFLSRRKGAMLLRLAPPSDGFEGFAQVGKLNYQESNGTARSVTLESTYDGSPVDARGHYYEQHSVGKTIALAILVSAMKDAAQVYIADREQAIATMRLAAERIDADAAALDDPALGPEVKLAKDLLALMEKGARQGTLYGE